MSVKKRILFITPYPLANAPSQRFRFEQYSAILDKNDFEVIIESFLSERSWTLLYKDSASASKLGATLFGYLKRIKLLFQINQYDLVFIHREAAPLGPPIFEWVIAKLFRKKIIYDFDDAIWLPDPDERGSLLTRLKWKSKVSVICKWSYKISVGNEFLAAYARQYNDHVVINPTTIDTEGLHNPELFGFKTPDQVRGDEIGTNYMTSEHVRELNMETPDPVQGLEKSGEGVIPEHIRGLDIETPDRVRGLDENSDSAVPGQVKGKDQDNDNKTPEHVRGLEKDDEGVTPDLIRGLDREVRGLDREMQIGTEELRQKLTIGWTGTHSTLQYLQPIIPVLRQLEKKYDFRFVVIANRNPDFDLKSFKFIQWSKETEIRDLLQFDIGLMPLSDDQWSMGKCGFKLLQYLALEIPAIASPVGVNSTIINESTGILAESREEWNNGLEHLINNPKKRKEMGKAGRDLVKQHYSVRSNTDNFLSLFY